MKIKQEKQFTLPQLIEWGFNNPCLAKERVYKIDDENDRFTPYVSFRADGSGVRIPCTITHDNTFTVEVEEEITEDTVIPKLMTTFKKTALEGGIGYQRVRIDENYPIKLMLNKAEAHREPVETLHIVNDDGTHNLIWTHEKGLVK